MTPDKVDFFSVPFPAPSTVWYNIHSQAFRELFSLIYTHTEERKKKSKKSRDCALVSQKSVTDWPYERETRNNEKSFQG